MKNLPPFFALLLALTACAPQTTETRVIAHRGYWDTPGSYENTLSSLRNAAQAGAWGSEFDIWITLAGIPVVYHNAVTPQGDTITRSTLERLRETPLPNGETIPTLMEYLNEGAGLDIKLVAEIKDHHSDSLNREAAKQVMMMVQTLNLADQVEYISFSRTICDELVRMDPKARVVYLEGDLTPQQTHALKYTGIDYPLSAMQAHPEWFAEAKNLGLTVNVWTVNRPADIQWVIQQGADYITTDNPVDAMRLAAETPPASK